MQLTPELRLAFVDAPGHERFVGNMLAGAGGMDMALLVVAANESVKPQTREHFEICRLLGVPRGVVALTKADLADAETVALVGAEVRAMAAGSFLESAPVVPVSSATGAGLDPLRAELARVAESACDRDAAGWFRLPIDRVFSVKGAGVVATGTLISGTVAREQEVEVYPSGRRLRVRGVQVHGAAAERAVAGQRTALNLAGPAAAELTRGDTLSEPGRFHAVRQIDCRLELLRSAKPMKHRAPVHFYSGTAEIEAQVRLLDGPGESPAAAIEPGARAWVRIVLREPALLLPGDRFIVRSYSPVTTIGGGVVADIGEGTRTRAELAVRLDAFAAADGAARIALLVKEAPYGVGLRELVARTGMTEQAIADAAAQGPLALLERPERWYVDRARFEAASARVAETVREFHRANPLAPGIAKEDLRARALPGAPAFLLDAILDRRDAAGLPVLEGNLARMPDHRVALKDDEAQGRAAMERAFEQAGLAAPTPAEAFAKSGVEPARARALLAMLLREKRLVRIGPDLILHQSAMQTLLAMLAARKPARFTVADFKSWTGVSRKYAIPLLEYLDRERVTRRDGDLRVIL
jgi:selenocysteine-specific elongation factor